MQIQSILDRFGGLVKKYDNYICVMPANDAIKVANLLANMGFLLDFELTLRDGDGVLCHITPEKIREAWKAVDTALHENWLGSGQREE
jgi:hypothetical protein